MGNLMFIWANAYVFAQENGLDMIWPTWPSLKIGPWIRREKDKRFYAGVFRNRSGHLDGIRKYALLLFSRKIPSDRFPELNEKNRITNRDLVVYDRFEMSFEKLLPHQEEICGLITGNLGEKGTKAMEFSPGKAVGIHVRCGDFSVNPEALARGSNNIRIPSSWYVNVIRQIRGILGEDTEFYLFSDGTDDELGDIMCLEGVMRCSFGNSIGDIIGLSKFPLLIVSGSSFSMWARFLGKCSAIGHTNQLKACGLAGEEGVEIETDGEGGFSAEDAGRILKLYARVM